jgi:uncharacterized phage-associated protein
MTSRTDNAANSNSVIVNNNKTSLKLRNWSTYNSGEEIRIVAGIPEPQDIANFILKLAASENEPEPITHLRLQKLMYYVQGWSLANRGRPAFSGRIEAWAHGPVVKELYPLLANFGNAPIPTNGLDKEASLISTDDAEFVAAVWNAYKGFSATALWEMTHSEFPWIKARGRCGPADRCNTEITHDDLKIFFSEQASTR